MKRVLITGENSYIGMNFKKWLAQYPQEYEVETISVRGDEWKEKDFSRFDVVYHVAGIAHIKETKDNQELYYQINRDLAVEVAKKSKESGIEQFIFLSTMSVYGLDEGIITSKTNLNPINAYGKSKLEAEELIQKLGSEKFKISIIRPPMVYGENCTGNYSKLSKLARVLLIFPEICNQRSMIYINNLSEFVRNIIDIDSDFGKTSIFFPQNKEYVTTSLLFKEIRKVNNRNAYLIKLPSFGNLLIKKIKVGKKMFGSLVYDTDLSRVTGFEYQVISFSESIKQTEEGNL